jgi:hypothetical protein
MLFPSDPIKYSYFSTFRLKMEGNLFQKIHVHLEYETMDKAQELSNPENSFFVFGTSLV